MAGVEVHAPQCTRHGADHAPLVRIQTPVSVAGVHLCERATVVDVHNRVFHAHAGKTNTINLLGAPWHRVIVENLVALFAIAHRYPRSTRVTASGSDKGWYTGVVLLRLVLLIGTNPFDLGR